MSRRCERLYCGADPGGEGRTPRPPSQPDARHAAEAVAERVAAFWNTRRRLHYLMSRRFERLLRGPVREGEGRALAEELEARVAASRTHLDTFTRGLEHISTSSLVI